VIDDNRRAADVHRPVGNAESTPAGSHRPLAATLRTLGLAGVPIYASIAYLSFQFAPEGVLTDRPILAVLAFFALAIALYLLALAKVLPLHSEEPGDLRGVLLFALVYRLILLPSWPIQEIDYYRYLWDGRVTLHGMNPYHYSPWQLDEVDATGEVAALQQLSYQSQTVRTIYERVHHREEPTAYPPLAQAVFALVVALTPAAAPLAVHLLVLKIVLLLFDMGTVFVLARLLRRLGLPATWCLAYAWCPLCLKEIANTAHLDAIAVFFTTLAFYLLVCRTKPEGVPQAPRQRALGVLQGMMALPVFALAVLAKTYPIFLLPLVAGYLCHHLRWRSLLPLAAFAGVLLLGYLPFLGGEKRSQVNNPGTGPAAFLARWEINDLAFMVLHRNLVTPGQGDDHWFVIVPAGWRQTFHDEVLEPWSERDGWPEGVYPDKMLAVVLTGFVVLLICLRETWRVWRSGAPVLLLGGAFRVLVWGWLLSSAQNPWYLLWTLPLMIFDGRRSWFLLTAFAFIYYVRFWVEYHHPDAVVSIFDFGLVWLEYVPFFVCLLIETILMASGERKQPEELTRAMCPPVAYAPGSPVQQ
jgi:hypothetical protein